MHKIIEFILNLFKNKNTLISGHGNLAAFDTFQLFQHIPVEIAIYDTDGNYTFVNPNYIGDEKLRNDVIGQNESFYFKQVGIDEEGLEVRRHNFNRALTERRTIRFTEKLFIPRRNKNLYYKRAFHPIFSDNSQKKISGICLFGSDLTAVIHGQQELKYLAFHDKLTGLRNRDGFYQQLDQILLELPREPETQISAILFCDLDNFKIVNDTLGHDFGDMVLREVATRLTNSLRKSDFVFRLGGDEFTVIIRHLKNEYEAASVAEKIIKKITELYEFGENKINYIGTSVGIVIIPREGGQREDLVKKADTAMYSAKKGGKNQYRFFKDDMSDDSLRRMQIENNLKSLVKDNAYDQECHMQYQPIIEMTPDGKYKIIGAEALLRWSNPELGALNPETFIPIAEETNLITPMGEWVFYNTCKEILPLLRKTSNSFYISINLSALQLRSNKIVDKVRKIIEAVQIDPKNIQLELTETSYIEDRVEIARNMLQLNQMGLRLAIDDFGIGFASLVYLQRIPASTIKIDRTFIQHIGNSHEHRQLVKSIINLGHNLEKDVIAEGVEEISHLKFLSSEKCMKYQGFLFSKPVSFEDLKKLVLTDNPFAHIETARNSS